MQVAEKSEGIRTELRDLIRRMQSLEWQNAEVRTSLDVLKNEINRLIEQPRTPNYNIEGNNRDHGDDNVKLEQKYDHLIRGVQLAVAAIRGLTFDVNGLRANISALLNKTE